MGYSDKQNKFFHTLGAQKADLSKKSVNQFDPTKVLQMPKKVKFPKLKQALTVKKLGVI